MKQLDRTIPAATAWLGRRPFGRPIRRYAACLLIAALIAACAALQETPAQRAQRIDPMLAASGFRMVVADSPKKQSIFGSLPPLKMHYYTTRAGKPRYWFADPYQCNCVYQGDEVAYQHYQNLRIQEQMVREEEQTAELNQDAAMQMNAFDPMFFPY
jgi:hypothetical protein